jgi:hypothetical protein
VTNGASPLPPPLRDQGLEGVNLPTFIVSLIVSALILYLVAVANRPAFEVDGSTPSIVWEYPVDEVEGVTFYVCRVGRRACRDVGMGTAYPPGGPNARRALLTSDEIAVLARGEELTVLACGMCACSDGMLRPSDGCRPAVREL